MYNPSRHPCPLPPGVVSGPRGGKSSGSGRGNQMQPNQFWALGRGMVTASPASSGRGGAARPQGAGRWAHRRFSASLHTRFTRAKGPRESSNTKSQSTFTHEWCWGRWS